MTPEHAKSRPRGGLPALAHCFLTPLLLLSAGAVQAQGFQLGNVQGLVDVTVSYGLGIRVEDMDENLIAAANGGRGVQVNNDDGNLNYDRGPYSNELRGTADLTLRWGEIGLYVRGAAGYDYETEQRSRERTELSSSARNLIGADAEVHDHYVSGRFAVGDIPVHFRLGDQVINWGETNFVRDGVDVINPINIAAALQPASRPIDLLTPQGMLWVAATLTETFAFEGYYQYDWKPVTLPPVGSFFSTNDLSTLR